MSEPKKHSEQPEEWTPELLKDALGIWQSSNLVARINLERLAAKLNAALAAEREKVKRAEANADKWFDEAEGNNNAYEQCVSAKHKVEQQLLAAQAAIAEKDKSLDHLILALQTSGYRIHEDDIRALNLKIDLSSLEKHDEEVRKE